MKYNDWEVWKDAILSTPRGKPINLNIFNRTLVQAMDKEGLIIYRGKEEGIPYILPGAYPLVKEIEEGIHYAPNTNAQSLRINFYLMSRTMAHLLKKSLGIAVKAYVEPVSVNNPDGWNSSNWFNKGGSFDGSKREDGN